MTERINPHAEARVEYWIRKSYPIQWDGYSGAMSEWGIEYTDYVWHHDWQIDAMHHTVLTVRNSVPKGHVIIWRVRPEIKPYPGGWTSYMRFHSLPTLDWNARTHRIDLVKL